MRASNLNPPGATVDPTEREPSPALAWTVSPGPMAANAAWGAARRAASTASAGGRFWARTVRAATRPASACWVRTANRLATSCAFSARLSVCSRATSRVGRVISREATNT